MDANERSSGMPMKLLKRAGKVAWLITLALIVSAFSMLIQLGSDASEKETTGIQKKWGFPITYRTTAPGLSWAKFDATRFGVNTVTWVILMTGFGFVFRKFKKKEEYAER